MTEAVSSVAPPKPHPSKLRPHPAYHPGAVLTPSRSADQGSAPALQSGGPALGLAEPESPGCGGGEVGGSPALPDLIDRVA